MLCWCDNSDRKSLKPRELSSVPTQELLPCQGVQALARTLLPAYLKCHPLTATGITLPSYTHFGVSHRILRTSLSSYSSPSFLLDCRSIFFPFTHFKELKDIMSSVLIAFRSEVPLKGPCFVWDRMGPSAGNGTFRRRSLAGLVICPQRPW